MKFLPILVISFSSYAGIPLVITAPASIAGTYFDTATMDFAPVVANVTAPIVYVGRGCPGDTFNAPPASMIALVDRGTCAVSLKVAYLASAGAVGVLVGLTAPGYAQSFVSGGGSNFVPSLVISQPIANAIKNSQSPTPTGIICFSSSAVEPAWTFESVSLASVPVGANEFAYSTQLPAVTNTAYYWYKSTSGPNVTNSTVPIPISGTGVTIPLPSGWAASDLVIVFYQFQ